MEVERSVSCTYKAVVSRGGISVVQLASPGINITVRSGIWESDQNIKKQTDQKLKENT